MDTRASRLRNAARAAVKEALEKEKENNTKRVLRSHTRQGKPLATRGLSSTTLQNRTNTNTTSKKDAVVSKPLRTTQKSKVKKPPNWSAIHAQEEERKKKKMQALKKPSTQAEAIKFHGDSRIKRAAAKTNTVTPSIPLPVGQGKVESSSEPSDSDFTADDSALSSILSNVGVQSSGYRATLGPRMLTSSIQKGHEEGLRNATKAIEMLQMKRASLYAGPRTVTNFKDRQSMYQSSLEIKPTTPSKPLRQSLHFGTGRILNVRREGNLSSEQTATSAQSILQRDARNLPSTPVSHTRQRHIVADTLANTVGDDSSFQINENALESIVSNRGVEVIADKAKRASVYHGPMRVTKKKSQTKVEPTASANEVPQVTPTRRYMSISTPSRYVNVEPVTPRSTIKRFATSSVKANVTETTTPRRMAYSSKAPVQSVMPQSSQKLTMMMTPRRSAAADKVASNGSQQRDTAQVKLQFDGFDGPLALSEAEAALEEIRRQEEELERELEQELLGEAAGTGESIPSSEGTSQLSAFAPVNNWPIELSFADEISTELININSRIQPSSSSGREFNNPVIIAIEGADSLFKPIQPDVESGSEKQSEPRRITFSGSAFRKTALMNR